MTRTAVAVVPQPDERHAHLRDAERSVLAAMLLEGGAIQRARAVVRAEDFNLVAHRLTFAAILALADRGEPATLVTVSDELKRRGDLGVCGGPYGLALVFDAVPVRVGIEHCCAIVREHAERRRLWRIALDLAARARDWALGIEDVRASFGNAVHAEAAHES